MNGKNAMRRMLALVGALMLVCVMGLTGALAEESKLRYAGASAGNADFGKSNGYVQGSVEFGPMETLLGRTVATSQEAANHLLSQMPDVKDAWIGSSTGAGASSFFPQLVKHNIPASSAAVSVIILFLFI